MDEVDKTAISTSSCTEDFRRGWNARTKLSHVTERHGAVIELVRTMRTWIKLADQTWESFGVPSWEETFLGTVTLGGFNETIFPNRFTGHDFRLWKYIMTADLGELDILLRETRGKHSYDSMVEDYRRLFGCSSDPKDWPEEISRRLISRLYSPKVSKLQHDIGQNSYHRTFFTTKGGSMGLGPRWMRSNDMIVATDRKAIPLIVRQAGTNYTLVGPAYVRELMERDEWDFTKRQMITLV
jgi:hypothetical protein